jgi:HEAT repeat protein
VEVRRAVILSLGRLGKGDHRVEAELHNFAKDPDSLSQVNAVIALAALGKADDSAIPILIKALGNEEKATAKAAVRALGVAGRKAPEKVVPTMIQILSQKQSQENALRVLRNMREAAKPALPTIVGLYDSADPAIRLEIMDAVVAIDKQGDYAIPVLVKLLKATDPLDRKEALVGLMRYRSKADDFLDPIADVLNDRDFGVKILAIRVIRGSGKHSPKVTSQLVDLCQDPDIRVRKEAIGALGSFRPFPHEALAALEKCLKDQNPVIRTAAAVQLGYVARQYPEEVTKMLESALAAEHDERAKGAIASTLKRLPKNSGAVTTGGHSTPPEAKGSVN